MTSAVWRANAELPYVRAGRGRDSGRMLRNLPLTLTLSPKGRGD